MSDDTQAELDRLRDLVVGLTKANLCLKSGYADAHAGLQYVLLEHGRLYGVGFDRVFDHYHEWVTMPEREGLQAGSHTLAAVKDRPR